jgi:hypothetical protein
MAYRENAERCRRLGYEFIGDPVSEKLLALADEYEARAAGQPQHLPERQDAPGGTAWL